MRSNLMKNGLEKAPHRSLFKAMGYTDEEIAQPIIGIANSANEIIPGHIHLDTLVEAVVRGVAMAGGTPVVFPAIGICDGLTMGHNGMRYVLASREHIADSVEIMASAHPFDALVLVTNCDKITPAMMMAALRLDIPAVVLSGGPMLAGDWQGQETDLTTVWEGVGQVAAGTMTEEEMLHSHPLEYRRILAAREYLEKQSLALDGQALSGAGRQSDGATRPATPSPEGAVSRMAEAEAD